MLSVCYKGRFGMRIQCLHRTFSAPPLVHEQTPSPCCAYIGYLSASIQREFSENIRDMCMGIGIDVEEIQRRLKHCILSFARRYFTDDVVEYLSGILDSEVQKRELLKLWTIKAILHVSNRSPTSRLFLGRGFSGAPFKTFNIRYKTSQKELPEIMVKSIDSAGMNLSSNRQFKVLELAGSHYAAICTETNAAEG